MDKWRKYFDEQAAKFGGSIKANDYYDNRQFWHMHNVVLNIIKTNNTQIISDVGCGNGTFTESFARNNVVYGIDFSFIMLQHARLKGLLPIQSDALFLPLMSDFSDVTICSGMLQLFKNNKDADKCLEELNRITKPGGTIIIATVNAESIVRKAYSLFRKVEGVSFERMYSVSEMFDKLNRLNIDIKETYFFYPLLPFWNKSSSPGILLRLLSATFLIVGQKKA